MPDQTILEEGIPEQSIHRPHRSKIIKQEPKPRISLEQSADRGYYPTFNDLDDKIIPSYKLDTYEQSVLRRLYRLSRGFKSQECEAGLGALSKACNISRSQAQKTISSLIERGLIHSLGYSQNGTKYKVLEQLPAIPPKGIPQSGIPQQDEGVPQESSHGIPQGGNNKNNKDLINTHTNTGGAAVGVRSRFSLEECRRYAEHLRATGDGITNPGGYATAIHRSGEVDELIERFLKPSSAPSVDASQCPDCGGSGLFYPQGYEGGVAKCRHEKLEATSAPVQKSSDQA
jgi:hypothetical protein